jgi:hypothetical protein
MTPDDRGIDVEAFTEKAEAWLEENLARRSNESAVSNYAIFHDRSHDE